MPLTGRRGLMKPATFPPVVARLVEDLVTQLESLVEREVQRHLRSLFAPQDDARAPERSRVRPESARSRRSAPAASRPDPSKRKLCPGILVGGSVCGRGIRSDWRLCRFCSASLRLPLKPDDTTAAPDAGSPEPSGATSQATSSGATDQGPGREGVPSGPPG